jgi:uracil-DNA glycosylase family 4
MIIGEAPGKEEDQQGLPFIGNAGHLLDELLAQAGIDRDTVYVTNAAKCRPPNNRDPTAGEIAKCRQYLEAEVAAVRPRFILLMGNAALRSFTGESGITAQRGRPSTHNGIIVMPTLHPASIFYTPANRAIVEQDLRYFRTLMRKGFIPPPATHIRPRLVDTPTKVTEMLAALTGIVSLDLETSPRDGIKGLEERKRAGLYPWLGQITAVGFGTDQGEFALLANHRDSPWTHDDIDDILAQAASRLESCYLVGQNGKFDQLFLKVHHGIDLELSFDTMLAHYLLDENQFHDLEYLARLYFNAPTWDISLEAKQGKASDVELANYLAHDLYYTRQLFAPLNEALSRDPQLSRLFHHLLMPLANLFVRIEAHGAYIDYNRLSDAKTFLNEEIDRATEALQVYADINWGSTQQVAQVLYNKLKLRCPKFTEKGAPSTDESSLNQIDHPIAGALKRFRAARQEYGLFIKGWEPYLVPARPNGWRLHPSFKLTGTVTGRASAEHPNLQQTTREPRVRSLIKAPDGWELWEADLSQIELRIIAELSDDPTMRETFRAGRDIHWTTALREIERGVGHVQLVLSTATTLAQRPIKDYSKAIATLLDAGPDAAAEIDKKWKDLRYGAKAVNFGFSFGMWWKRFKLYARDTYGLEITDKQAQQSRIAFFQLYSRLPNWHELQKRLARLQGHVRSLDGQKRRLPDAQASYDSPEKQEAYRQAINSPVQCFAAKINWMILLQLAEEFPWTIFRPIATVHDSILAEIRDDQVERIAARYLEIVKCPQLFEVLHIELSIPFDGDCKIGPWGSGVGVAKWRTGRVDPSASPAFEHMNSCPLMPGSHFDKAEGSMHEIHRPQDKGSHLQNSPAAGNSVRDSQLGRHDPQIAKGRRL